MPIPNPFVDGAAFVTRQERFRSRLEAAGYVAFERAPREATYRRLTEANIPMFTVESTLLAPRWALDIAVFLDSLPEPRSTGTFVPLLIACRRSLQTRRARHSEAVLSGVK